MVVWCDVVLGVLMLLRWYCVYMVGIVKYGSGVYYGGVQ